MPENESNSTKIWVAIIGAAALLIGAYISRPSREEPTPKPKPEETISESRKLSLFPWVPHSDSRAAISCEQILELQQHHLTNFRDIRSGLMREDSNGDKIWFTTLETGDLPSSISYSKEFDKLTCRLLIYKGRDSQRCSEYFSKMRDFMDQCMTSKGTLSTRSTGNLDVSQYVYDQQFTQMFKIYDSSSGSYTISLEVDGTRHFSRE